MDWVCSHSKERKYKKTFAREKHGCYPLISSNRPCQNSTGATFSEQNLKKQSWQRLYVILGFPFDSRNIWKENVHPKVCLVRAMMLLF